MMKNNKIMLIAGEASGDMHGAVLVNEMKQLMPNLDFTGLGGTYLQQAGVKLIANMADFSVCGFFEVVRYLPRLYSLYRTIKRQLIANPPDLLILIDYPTFNLILAKVAAKLKIKVLYYISPQIWAWHTSRVTKIKDRVHTMGVIFPFEADFYRQHQVPVKYVGHPLAGRVTVTQEKEQLKQHYHIPPTAIVIGLLPGSRQNEIKYILPTLLQMAEQLQAHKTPIRFLLPLASTLIQHDLNPLLAQCKADVQIISNNRYDAMSICDVVVAASGTVTLELALLGIPMVIVYKANRFSFAIAKRVVKIPYVGLCNIIAKKKIVQELIQEQANCSAITAEVLKLLDDKAYCNEQKRQLSYVAQQLFTQKESSIGELAVDVLKAI